MQLNCSTRRGGNTAWLAQQVTQDLDCRSIYLDEFELTPLPDLRHGDHRYPPLEGELRDLFELLLEAPVVVIATPVYWYGMPAPLKLFVDRWSQAMRDPGLEFKERMAGKLFYAVLVGGDQPRIKALPYVQQIHYTVDFCGAKLAGWVIGEANAPGDIQEDHQALASAAALNETITAQLEEVHQHG